MKQSLISNRLSRLFKRTRLVLLMTLLVLSSGLLGCQKTSKPEHDEPAVDLSANEKSVGTITDRLDRDVLVTQPAKRIISLSPATTELLFALNLKDSMIGVTTNCNFPPAALEISQIGGGTLESISLEEIVSAKPDLVVCHWEYHQPLLESLDRLGIRSLAIGARNLDELFEEAKWVGLMTDRVVDADSLITKMSARRDKLSKFATEAKTEPPLKVFYEVWDDPLMTAGSGSFIDEVLSLAGLENIAGKTKIRYPRISSETVLRADPDLILAPTSHFENIDIAEIRSRPGWQNLSAVKKERIYLISGDEISRCGPRVLDALEEIVRVAYPEASASLPQGCNIFVQDADRSDQQKAQP